MPVRKRSTAVNKSANRKEKVIDLEFLPEKYIRRIDDIFDSYLHLGMKRRFDKLEESAPIFPIKVASITSQDLGNTLSEYTAWFSFATDKHKYIVVAHNFIQKEVQKVFDVEMDNLLLEKGNIESKKSSARNSETYKAMQVYSSKLEGLKTLLDRELDNYDRCISSLSREVARREHSGGY